MVFSIRNSRDFYQKLLQEFDDFRRDNLSARHAINCAVTAYHMHEWVWGDWLKKNTVAKAKLGISDKDSFLAWIDTNEPFFSVVQDLANGSKHFDRKTMQKTQVAGAFDAAASDGHAFDIARLEVELDDGGGETRRVLAEILFNDLIVFWRDFLREYGPFADLPTPEAHVTEFK